MRHFSRALVLCLVGLSPVTATEPPAPFVPLPNAPRPDDLAPVEYIEVGAKIPHYVPGEKWGTQAQPLTKMQRPLPPEESVRRYVVPEGFELRIFATETRDPQTEAPPYAGLGGKPIAMNWDERGRLWVCETLDYPNELQPENRGRDRIRICEDTDGDGAADTFTLFAEGLSIPTAVLPIYGGAIVQNGTETLFLKDLDGDGQADLREVLMTGWNMQDTHGGVSNFRYGLDNWVYAMQGYNDSQPVIAATGEKGPRFRQGFWRMKLAPPKELSVESAELREKGNAERATPLDTQLSTLNSQHAPQVLQIEFLRSTNNNTWGLGFSEEGLIFGSTANHNPSEFLPIPNRYYERVRGWSPQRLEGIADSHLFQTFTDKVRQVDHFGGYTAGCGHALYTARNYPRQYWNQTAFVCEPTAHLVGTFVLTADGAGFQSTSPCNLIASDDEWAAPIMAEVGPDGNVWILDWYNYIVQHNPTPQGFRTGKGNAYESDLRDKKHGRIYRLVYTPNPGVANAGSLPTSATSEQLLAALRDPTLPVRLQAQRLLIERWHGPHTAGKARVIQQLTELITDETVDELGLNVAALHALWTLHGIGALDRQGPTGAITAALASSPAKGLVRNALQASPRWRGLFDPEDDTASPQDRLAWLLATADVSPPTLARATADPEEAFAIGAAGLVTTDGDLLALLSQQETFAQDRWLRDALTAAAATHAIGYLAALSQPILTEVAPTAENDAEPKDDCLDDSPGAHPPRPLMDLKENPLAGASLPIARIVAEHLARSGPDAHRLESLLILLNESQDPLVNVLLDGLAAGWPKDHRVELSAEANRALLELLDRVAGADKAKVIRFGTLIGAQGLEEQAEAIAASLLTTIANVEEPVPVRRDAAAQLISFRPQNPAAVTGMAALLTPQTHPVLARGLIEVLGNSTAGNVGPELAARMTGLTPELRDAAVRVLLSRPQTTLALLEGIESGRLLVSDLKLDQQAALQNHPDRAVQLRARRILSAGGNLPDPDRQKVLEALLPITRETGDIAAGREVFKKHCAKCHRHGGEGATIAPDLTGMAVHPKSELLVHILDPNRSVEGNFRSYTVVLSDGLVVNGMLAGESQTTIELIDSEAKRHSLVRDDIDDIIASTKSMMPDGFEKTIPREEFIDLMEFLTAKGRWVPLDLRKVATSISTQPMFVSESNDHEKLIFPDWSPREFRGVPFQLIDPRGDQTPNVILLHGPQGKWPPQMPHSVRLPLNAPVKAVHLLSGVSGWGHPVGEAGSVSMIVRLHYTDGQTEDHELKNGIHFADYIRRIDVPGSEFAFALRGQQIRYLSVPVQRQDVPVKEVELLKGADRSAPVVMAITAETP